MSRIDHERRVSPFGFLPDFVDLPVRPRPIEQVVEGRAGVRIESLAATSEAEVPLAPVFTRRGLERFAIARVAIDEADQFWAVWIKKH